MDHRSCERKRVLQPVTLLAPRAGSLAATMRDLSLGGMFVETGPAGLSQNATVTVSFRLPYGSQEDTFRLEAVVVRRGQDGSGLMFVRMDNEVIRALSDALSRYLGSGSGRDTPPAAPGQESPPGEPSQ